MSKLPVDMVAERSVLGGIILEPGSFAAASEILSNDDFADAANREIWKAAKVCIADGQLDLVTLNSQLEKQNAKSKGVSIKLIADICNEVPQTAPEAVKNYAEIVADCGERRRKMIALNQAMQQLSDTSCDIVSADAYVQNVVLAPSTKSCTKGFKAAFENYCKEYSRREKLGGTLPGAPCGFADLDIMLGGFENGKMYVVGGRPGMGKTAYALNIAVGLAARGKNVLYFSLEMGELELTQRINGIASGVVIRKMQNCRLSADEINKISTAVDKLGDRIMINEESYQTSESILTECVMRNTYLAARNERVDAVIIDHLQLMSSSAKHTERRSQIGEASRMCKISAKKLNCPFIVLSQLSRAAKDRKDQSPRLTDLRESGDIEQDADVVMLIHRNPEEKKDSVEFAQTAKIIVAKNRNGQTGLLRYKWYPEKNRFSENTSPNVEISD